MIGGATSSLDTGNLYVIVRIKVLKISSWDYTIRCIVITVVIYCHYLIMNLGCCLQKVVKFVSGQLMNWFCVVKKWHISNITHLTFVTYGDPSRTIALGV